MIDLNAIPVALIGLAVGLAAAGRDWSHFATRKHRFDALKAKIECVKALSEITSRELVNRYVVLLYLELHGLMRPRWTSRRTGLVVLGALGALQVGGIVWCLAVAAVYAVQVARTNAASDLLILAFNVGAAFLCFGNARRVWVALRDVYKKRDCETEVWEHPTPIHAADATQKPNGE